MVPVTGSRTRIRDVALILVLVAAATTIRSSAVQYGTPSCHRCRSIVTGTPPDSGANTASPPWDFAKIHLPSGDGPYSWASGVGTGACDPLRLNENNRNSGALKTTSLEPAHPMMVQFD